MCVGIISLTSLISCGITLGTPGSWISWKDIKLTVSTLLLKQFSSDPLQTSISSQFSPGTSGWWPLVGWENEKNNCVWVSIQTVFMHSFLTYFIKYFLKFKIQHMIPYCYIYSAHQKYGDSLKFSYYLPLHHHVLWNLKTPMYAKTI